MAFVDRLANVIFSPTAKWRWLLERRELNESEGFTRLDQVLIHKLANTSQGERPPLSASLALPIQVQGYRIWPNLSFGERSAQCRRHWNSRVRGKYCGNPDDFQKIAPDIPSSRRGFASRTSPLGEVTSVGISYLRWLNPKLRAGQGRYSLSSFPNCLRVLA